MHAGNGPALEGATVKPLVIQRFGANGALDESKLINRMRSTLGYKRSANPCSVGLPSMARTIPPPDRHPSIGANHSGLMARQCMRKAEVRRNERQAAQA
jgi:hypothetical protein